MANNVLRPSRGEYKTAKTLTLRVSPELFQKIAETKSRARSFKLTFPLTQLLTDSLHEHLKLADKELSKLEGGGTGGQL